MKLKLKNPARATSDFAFEFPDHSSIADLKQYLSLVSRERVRSSRASSSSSLPRSDVTRRPRALVAGAPLQTYPGTPRTADQKLVFAGQLLHDHQMLDKIFETVRRPRPSESARNCRRVGDCHPQTRLHCCCC